MFIEFSCLHSRDDGVERCNELVLARNHDRCLALLELNRLRAVADAQPDSSKNILFPPRTHPLLQLNELFAPCFVVNPLRHRDGEVGVLGERLLLLKTMKSLERRAKTGFVIPCS